MPRKKIPFRTLDTPRGPLRYVLDDTIGVRLFVALDVARALGYPHIKAATTTEGWHAYGHSVCLIPGRKKWRMLTDSGIQEVCRHSRKPGAPTLSEWFARQADSAP